MASTMSSRPSHYDALGLSPEATQDEIAGAFARAMGLFGARSAAAAAQIGLAFETLRKPEKRRAYDESLGLRRAPAPVPAPMAVSFRISAPASPPEPHVEPTRGPAGDSFIATSLREIARPVELSPSNRPAARPEPPVAGRPVMPAAAEAEVIEEADRPFDWKRPAVGVGAIVLAAGLIGALAGISVRDDAQSPADAVTTVLPSAKARPHVTQPAPVEATVSAPTISPAPERPSRAQRPAKRLDQVPEVQAPTGSAEAAQAAPDQAGADAVQPASAEAVADPLAPKPESSIETVAAAGLPLASNLVARTIERIGYSCGAVASTTAVDGAAGVYNVTCTSGDSYRAVPVRGRYRFHRLSSH